MSLLSRLPLSPARLVLLAEFLRFGIVGASGAVVDTAVVYATMATLGLYGAGAVSYVAAATWTWAMNRMWTFAGRGEGPLWREWLRWMGVNMSGMVLNRGLYVILVATSATVRAYPVLAVAAGAVAGMFANFILSRRMVFRRKP